MHTFSLFTLSKYGLKWREWIKECVPYASFSILMNGATKVFFFFNPSREVFHLCQVDPPLSPFLFFLVGEALCRIIGDANLVSGFKPARVALVVNHLQFFNDILNFCDVEEDQIMYEQQHITTLFLSKLIHRLCWSSIFLYVDDMLFFYLPSFNFASVHVMC